MPLDSSSPENRTASTSGNCLHNGTENNPASIQRLMVIIDLELDQTSLLLQALQLHAQYRCQVYMVALFADSQRSPETEAQLASALRQLHLLSMPYFTDADAIQTSLVTYNQEINSDCGNAAEAVEAFVLNNGIDLAMKSGCSVDNYRYNTMDRALIHTLNCNLYFVPETVDEKSAVIVSAIDAKDERQRQQLLNQQVASWTKTMSAGFGCAVTAVSVINIELALQMLNAVDTLGTEPNEKKALKEKVQTLLAQHRIDSPKVVISAGDPARKILSNANSHNARLVVVGSTDHDMQAPTFSGNTAEKVLHRIQAPLLIVKNHNMN